MPAFTQRAEKHLFGSFLMDLGPSNRADGGSGARAKNPLAAQSNQSPLKCPWLVSQPAHREWLAQDKDHARTQCHPRRLGKASRYLRYPHFERPVCTQYRCKC